MTSDGGQRGRGGVWRRCNFQISKIVDSSFNEMYFIYIIYLKKILQVQQSDCYACAHQDDNAQTIYHAIFPATVMSRQESLVQIGLESDNK